MKLISNVVLILDLMSVVFSRNNLQRSVTNFRFSISFSCGILYLVRQKNITLTFWHGLSILPLINSSFSSKNCWLFELDVNKNETLKSFDSVDSFFLFIMLYYVSKSKPNFFRTILRSLLLITGAITYSLVKFKLLTNILRC